MTARAKSSTMITFFIATPPAARICRNRMPDTTCWWRIPNCAADRGESTRVPLTPLNPRPRTAFTQVLPIGKQAHVRHGAGFEGTRSHRPSVTLLSVFDAAHGSAPASDTRRHSRVCGPSRSPGLACVRPARHACGNRCGTGPTAVHRSLQRAPATSRAVPHATRGKEADSNAVGIR